VRILAIDIETRPNLAHVWSLWNVNVGLPQLIEPAEMICFAAQFVGEKRMHFYSVFHHGQQAMVEKAHALLEEADVVLTFNGSKFDVPHLQTEFVKAGLKPPAPFRQIDLYKTIKKQFRFPSGKLAYVSKALGLKGKVSHSGHELWVRCMAGDEKAWALMRRYCKQDTALLPEMLEILRPWIPNFPSYAAFRGEDVCPACGSEDLKPQGFAFLRAGKYQRWLCNNCSKWSRSSRRLESTSIVEVA
jgi:uncharacterized protein